MDKIRIIILFSAILLSFFAYTQISFAKTDLSIAENDITFSKLEPLDGDLVRIYARVFNAGDGEVSGFVVFLSNGKEIADRQQAQKELADLNHTLEQRVEQRTEDLLATNEKLQGEIVQRKKAEQGGQIEIAGHENSF